MGMLRGFVSWRYSCKNCETDRIIVIHSTKQFNKLCIWCGGELIPIEMEVL